MAGRVNIARYHKDFEARVDELLEWESAIDDMVAGRKEWYRRRMCETILVLAFSHWERFVENLFGSLLAADLSQLGKTCELPRLKGRVGIHVAHAIMAGDERYFDIRGFDDLLASEA